MVLGTMVYLRPIVRSRTSLYRTDGETGTNGFHTFLEKLLHSPNRHLQTTKDELKPTSFPFPQDIDANFLCYFNHFSLYSLQEYTKGYVLKFLKVGKA